MDTDLGFKFSGTNREVAELTSAILHAYYCRNDVGFIVSQFDDSFSWFGTGEGEYAIGADTVSAIFRQFAGQVPACNTSEEQYHVQEIAPGAYLCSGLLWIVTDPSTNTYLRVHQRITAAFRETPQGLACCHIHISNPSSEMQPGDRGFPTGMARQSYEYLQEQVALQRAKLEEQTAELRDIYNTVPCAIMRFSRTNGHYTLLAANHATADMTGVKQDNVQDIDWTRGFCSCVAEEYIPHMEAALRGLVEPGDSTSATYRLVQPSGRTVHVNSVNSLIATDGTTDIIQRIVFDVTERITLETALRQKSFEDELTGLYNRSKFRKRLEDGDYRETPHLGIAYFDVNGLKAMNDQHGHAAGDNLICQVARHIDGHFEGRTYRIGGDEFVVIDTELGQEAFESTVRTVLDEMAHNGISVAVGISWRGADKDIKAQFYEADKRMYEDKARYYRDEKHDRRADRHS